MKFYIGDITEAPRSLFFFYFKTSVSFWPDEMWRRKKTTVVNSEGTWHRGPEVKLQLELLVQNKDGCSARRVNINRKHRCQLWTIKKKTNKKKLFCDQTDQHLKTGLETRSSGLQEWNCPTCCQQLLKPVSLMVWGCICACGIDSLHIRKSSISAKVLEHMVVSRARNLDQTRMRWHSPKDLQNRSPQNL